MSEIPVRAGQSLQAAIDSAGVDDVLLLEPAAPFYGQFKLKSNLTIRTAGEQPERRIGPSDGLARIWSGVGAAPFILSGLTKVRMIALDFSANVGGDGDIIQVNDCSDIEGDRLRCIVPDYAQQKRFFLGNGRDIRLRRSHVSGIWKSGQDSQAFCAWDGAGPYRIEDCYLEAASENVMFGGADSSSDAAVPADIIVTGCHFTKNLAWKTDSVSQVIKNLFELKAARRVVVRNNLFEHHWGGEGQPGTAIVFTPVNQNATAPWSGIEDVLFEQNIVRDVPMGLTVTGYGYDYRDPDSPNGPTRQTTRIVVRNNDWQCDERAFFVANEIGDLAIYGNTVTLPSGGVLLSLDATKVWPEGEAERDARAAVERFVWGQPTLPGTYIHSGRALDAEALKLYAPGYTTTVEEPPMPEPPDALDELRTRIEAEEAVNVAQTQRLEAVLTKLRSLPPNAKVQQVVQTLRSL